MKNWRAIVRMLALPALIVWVLIGQAVSSNRTETRLHQTSCEVIRGSIASISATAELAERLGIPFDTPVPVLPPECEEMP